MQDRVVGHTAGVTRIKLRERGIEVIYWPAFSQDRNPIERVWHIMKNYLEDNFPENMSYDRLREAVKEGWANVGPHEYRGLVESMPARCRADTPKCILLSIPMREMKVVM